MADKINGKPIQDSDGDGLSDQEEKLLGTNPDDPDTDQDGISDSQEIKMGSNPREAGFLKDFFIPHAGNNYKPKVLEPRRLFFHALAAGLVKALLLAFLLSFPTQAWLTPDILVEQARRIVTLTNNIRAAVQVNLLAVSETLEQAALAKAQDMLVGQYFAHVSPSKKSLKSFLGLYKYNYKSAGENLALGFSSGEEVVEAWTQSPSHDANLVDPDFREIGVAVVSGPYQGYPTTLVAQFFGEPKISRSAGEEFATTTAILPAVKDLSIVAGQDIPNSEVLAVNIEGEKLAAPKLVSPQNKSVLAKNKIYFNIAAPGAEQIVVWDNSQILFSAAVANGLVTAEKELAAGDYQLVIEAKRGPEKSFSARYDLTIDQSGPVVEQERTFITASETVDKKNIILRVEAYLSADTKEAGVSLAGRTRQLYPDFGEENKWTGYLVIGADEKKDFFSPLVLATLSASDKIGNQSISDIDWKNIVVAKTSTLDQYTFLKQTQPQLIRPLFDISYAYYKGLLFLAIIASLLNVFIKIKIQHSSVVLSSLSFVLFIGLLVIL